MGVAAVASLASLSARHARSMENNALITRDFSRPRHNMAAYSAFDPRRLLSLPRFYRTFQRMVTSDHDRLIGQLFKIRPGQRVLDIGCGPVAILSRLPADVDYVGLDLDHRYIEEARLRYGNRGSFYVRALTPQAIDDLGTFDVVLSIGVLHHLDDDEADTVFASAAKVLRPDGRLVTVDGAIVKARNPVARVLLKLDRGRHDRSPEAYLALARRYFPDSTAFVFHDLLGVPYTHCLIEAQAPSGSIAGHTTVRPHQTGQ
jgi:SAM-dependent methyltransferase